MYSTIKLTFTEDLILNRHFGFQVDSPVPDFILAYVGYRMVNTRYASGQVVIGTPTATPGERTALNFLNAFNLDWANTGPYSAVAGPLPNEVTITGTIPTIDFSNTFSYDDVNEFPPSINFDVEFDIDNYAGTPFYITDIELIPAVLNPPCTHYGVRVTTNILTDYYTYYPSAGSPVTVYSNTDQPFEFDIPRGMGYALHCFTDEGQQTIAPHFSASASPYPISAAGLNINIVPSPLGATVTLIYLTTSGTVLEYSLNGVDWQSSNVFEGIMDGNYTARIRSLGCVASLDFGVNSETGITEGYFEISESNSFRFARRDIIGDCGPYLGDDNSLSHEFYAKDPDLAYCEKQLFQACDTITTQFKSNYANISAKVIKEDGTEDVLVVNQMTNFIGRKDSRDATRYNIGSGKTGIYFTTGNLYDYDSGVDSGNDYILNGTLPEYGRIGNWIFVNGGFYQIEAIIFDEAVNADVLVIDAIYLGSPEEVIVKAQFNRQKYNVFEFTTILSGYNNQDIKIQITNQDDDLGEVIHLSEIINVKTKQTDTAEVIYYNTSNTDMYYSTGIKNLIRIPLLGIEASHNDESETLIGDSKSNLISSTVHQLNGFEFGLVTTGIYRKIVQALSHKFVFINKTSYVKNGSIEKDGPLEDSNLYIVKAELLKSNLPFTSHIQGVEPDIAFSEENLEVPAAVIDSEGNPIVYE